LLAAQRTDDSDIPSVDDERALVERAKHDGAAFAQLYGRYADSIYRYCYRRLGDPNSASDATSRVFTKALAGLPHCRSESFRSWLFAIAHHAIVDDFRERTRAMEPIPMAMDLHDEEANPERHVLAAEAAGAVRELLRQLPEDQRSVVELRLAGLSGSEIALVSGLSLSAVKSIQFRAYRRLRTLMGSSQLTTRT